MRKFKKNKEKGIINKINDNKKHKTVYSKPKVYDYRIVYNDTDGSIKGKVIEGVTYQEVKMAMAMMLTMGKRNVTLVCKRDSASWRPINKD